MKCKTTVLALGALLAATAAPAFAAVGEEQRATGKTRGAADQVLSQRELTSVTPLPALGQAFSQAIAIQSDLTVGDWNAAGMHLDDLKRQLRGLRAQALPAETARRLQDFQPVVENLEAGLRNRDLARAQSASYYVVNAFLTSMDTLATVGGGGGAGEAAGALLSPTPMEQLRLAYESTGRAQLALLRRDTAGAGLSLEAAARQLKAAREARPGTALGRHIQGLEQRVGAARAALDEPDRAATETRRAVVAFADAMRQIATASRPAEGQEGGGGGQASPAPEPSQDDMDRLIEMEQRGLQRPNQRGRQ